MTKIMRAVILTLVIIFQYTVSYAVAQEMIEKKGGTSEVSGLLGKGVKNPKGEDLGTITDLVVGPEGRLCTFRITSKTVLQASTTVQLGSK